MIIGFTGTRVGITPAQRATLRSLIEIADELHHGDCKGADITAHRIAVDLWGWSSRVVVHPPEDGKLRAYAGEGAWILPVKPYLARNRDIVDACDRLIATPKERSPSQRKGGGGTWYTIDYAMKVGRPVSIIWPDGEVTTT